MDGEQTYYVGGWRVLDAHRGLHGFRQYVLRGIVPIPGIRSGECVPRSRSWRLFLADCRVHTGLNYGLCPRLCSCSGYGKAAFRGHGP